MHGLINRAIQSFVTDSYGANRWQEVVRRAELEFSDFEVMLTYDTELTSRVLDTVAEVLGRPRPEVMEDMGTYLVSHANVQALRRLLRFGGATFLEFLHSLDDLPGRARFAVSDLDLPPIELRDENAHSFTLICRTQLADFAHVLMGVLRAMADDYGVLALLDFQGRSGDIETVSITLVETEFTEGRVFDLAARAV